MHNTEFNRTRFSDLVILMFLVAMAFVGFSFLFNWACHAQEVVPPPAGISSTTPAWLADLVTKFPWVTTVLLVIGALRVVAKPAFSALHAFAEAQEWKTFDAWADKAEASSWFKVVSYVLDWGGSIKLVKK